MHRVCPTFEFLRSPFTFEEILNITHTRNKSSCHRVIYFHGARFLRMVIGSVACGHRAAKPTAYPFELVADELLGDVFSSLKMRVLSLVRTALWVVLDIFILSISISLDPIQMPRRGSQRQCDIHPRFPLQQG